MLQTFEPPIRKSTRCFTMVCEESGSHSSVGLDLLGDGLPLPRLLKTFLLGGGPKSTFFSSIFAYFSANNLRIVSQFTVAWSLVSWNSQYAFGSLVHFYVWGPPSLLSSPMLKAKPGGACCFLACGPASWGLTFWGCFHCFQVVPRCLSVTSFRLYAFWPKKRVPLLLLHSLQPYG